MDNLRKYVQNNSGGVVQTFTAKVTELNENEQTLTVEHDKIKTFDVRLKAIVESTESEIIIYPTIGSYVTVGILYNDEKEVFVVQYSEIDKIQIKIDKAEFVITKDGFLIKKENENLLSVLQDFVTEVSKIIVVQGTSPNVPALTQISNRFKTILNDV